MGFLDGMQSDNMCTNQNCSPADIYIKGFHCSETHSDISDCKQVMQLMQVETGSSDVAELMPQQFLFIKCIGNGDQTGHSQFKRRKEAEPPALGKLALPTINELKCGDTMLSADTDNPEG